MLCKNCGNPLPDTASFCDNCGQLIEAEATNTLEGAPAESTQIPGQSYGQMPANTFAYANDGPQQAKLAGGARGWSIFCIVVNALAALGNLVSAITNKTPLLFLSVVLSAAVITGFFLLLQTKKLGFYIVCGCAAVSIIINIISGSYGAAVFGLLNPLITWLLLRKQWNILK